MDEIETFTLVALAGIGDMPDTIEDRAVITSCVAVHQTSVCSPTRAVAMVQPYTSCAAASPSLHQLAEAEPAIPVEDRAADTWEPLITIADAAAGHSATSHRSTGLTQISEGLTQSDPINTPAKGRRIRRR